MWRDKDEWKTFGCWKKSHLVSGNVQASYEWRWFWSSWIVVGTSVGSSWTQYSTSPSWQRPQITGQTNAAKTVDAGIFCQHVDCLVAHEDLKVSQQEIQLKFLPRARRWRANHAFRRHKNIRLPWLLLQQARTNSRVTALLPVENAPAWLTEWWRRKPSQIETKVQAQLPTRPPNQESANTRRPSLWWFTDP